MMKKLLPVLLALLLLAGCGEQIPEPSTTDGTEPVAQGLYDPDSAVERDTNGAVRAYRLDRNDYFGLSAMGSRLLLRAQDGTMTVLQGDTCVPSVTMETGVPFDDLSTVFDSSVQGAAYYLRDSREVVLVNPQLQQTDRIQLPQDIQGDPCIDLARSEIFYCVPGEVRALNTQSGISRLIRSHSYANQQLHGLYFDGQMLLCELSGEEMAARSYEYISADTGKTFYSGDAHLLPLYTWGDAYVLNRLDGGVNQTIVGTREGQAKLLALTEEQFASALPLGCVIGYTTGDDNIVMRCYDVTSGVATAHVTLHGVSSPLAFLTAQEAIWILAQEDQKPMLYRWDITKSPANDGAVYTGKLFTAEEPDVAGLELCRARAEEMGNTYGVKIHVWEELLRDMSGGDTVTAEYQVQAVNAMLNDLEAAMERFPEGFLQQTLEAGQIHIYLARSISTKELTAQYWREGDCYIVIANQGKTYEGFLQGVAYAIDSHVLGNSRKFDDWNKLNPEGFFYSYSYGQRSDADAYLGGADSAFLTEKAMAYPHDDRSSIFLAAMTAGGAEVFDSDVMQAKLERLCRGIREAYRLEKSPQVYPWEQYLHQSLAYTK